MLLFVQRFSQTERKNPFGVIRAFRAGLPREAAILVSNARCEYDRDAVRDSMKRPTD
jgi:hypothetical protein